MKFLEELKAAQAIIEIRSEEVYDNRYLYKGERDCLEAVLRRIPQLIEGVEILENLSAWEWKGESYCCAGRNVLAIELLSKLEGEKEEKPINGQSEQLTKEKEMNEEVMKLIKEMAIKEIASDEEDFMVNDYAGGNIDDAYYLGFEDGQVSFARSIVEALGREKI